MTTTTALLPSGARDEAIICPDFSGNVTLTINSSNLAVNVVVSSAYILVFESSSRPEDSSNINKAILQINFNDVIGVKAEENISSRLCLQVYEYTHDMKGCMSGEDRVKRVSSFHFPNDDQCRKWATEISAMITNSYAYSNNNSLTIDNVEKIEPIPLINGQNSNKIIQKRKYLVFVNPNSGTKHAMDVYESTRDMFKEADIDVTLVITQHALHAKDYVQDASKDLNQFGCLCVISGDGLLYKIINGIANRPDGSGFELLKVLPIAPIPGGTGNGLAKSICFASNNEPYSAINCTFIAIKGHSHPLDLSRVTTTNTTHFSFLSLGWGLISDIDILSESMRCMGDTRLYAAAVYFIASRRKYKGILRMILTTETESDSRAALSNDADDADIFRSPATIPYRKKIDGEFLLIWVVQTSHAASSMHSGPGVELDDAVFTIYVVRDMSRCGLLQLLIDIDTGDHVKNTNVEVYKAHSYSIEPAPGDASKDGIYSLDGEVIEYGPIQGNMLPHAARVLKL